MLASSGVRLLLFVIYWHCVRSDRGPTLLKAGRKKRFRWINVKSDKPGKVFSAPKHERGLTNGTRTKKCKTCNLVDLTKEGLASNSIYSKAKVDVFIFLWSDFIYIFIFILSVFLFVQEGFFFWGLKQLVLISLQRSGRKTLVLKEVFKKKQKTSPITGKYPDLWDGGKQTRCFKPGSARIWSWSQLYSSESQILIDVGGSYSLCSVQLKMMLHWRWDAYLIISNGVSHTSVDSNKNLEMFRSTVQKGNNT